MFICELFGTKASTSYPSARKLRYHWYLSNFTWCWAGIPLHNR